MGQGRTLPFRAAASNLPGVPRWILLLLPALLLWSADPPTSFAFVETVAGKPAPGSDRSAIEGLAKLHRERLTRARAELPTATPAIARLIRADIGALEAELERLAVVGGGTLVVGRRTFTVQPGLIAVDSDGTRLDVDPTSGRGRSFANVGAEPVAVEMAPAPGQVPLARGEVGPPVAGRETRRFSISADGRDYNVLIDPTLINPFARLIPLDREDAAITLELAKLPGMPLDIAFDSGDFVRRFTCVEVK